MIIHSNIKQLEPHKVKARKISSPQARYLYQHVVLENWNIFNLHFFYDFYLYHAYNDVIWSFFQVQNKWRTRNSKEGGYGALNPDTNTSMLHLRSKIWFIINSSMTFYLYHADNVVLWSFFQIQNNWSFRKLTLCHPGFWILVITRGVLRTHSYILPFWAFLCPLASMLNHI